MGSMFASKGGWIPELSDMQKWKDKIRQIHDQSEVQHSLVIGIFPCACQLLFFL